jgi:uncharacterized membrane-anchored protein
MKNIAFIAFVLTCAAQWFVPANMIWQRERILDAGVAYKFKTAPVDPSDPFRGRYVQLWFENNSLALRDTQLQWNSGEDVYLSLGVDSAGYAVFIDALKMPPVEGDYLQAKVSYVDYSTPRMMWINLPFDRFYMEETSAPKAEQQYNEASRDTTKVTYAVVKINDGQAVLEDVMIDGVSLRN